MLFRHVFFDCPLSAILVTEQPSERRLSHCFPFENDSCGSLLAVDGDFLGNFGAFSILKGGFYGESKHVCLRASLERFLEKSV